MKRSVLRRSGFNTSTRLALRAQGQNDSPPAPIRLTQLIGGPRWSLAVISPVPTSVLGRDDLVLIHRSHPDRAVWPLRLTRLVHARRSLLAVIRYKTAEPVPTEETTPTCSEDGQ